MSRNRCSTDCYCGLWSFQTESFFPPGDPSLLTEQQYLDAIGFEDCPYRLIGHGYDARLVGEHFSWELRDENGKLVGYSSNVRVGYTRVLSGAYLDVPPEDRYRFRKLECVFCRRLYVGWYRQDPVNVLLAGKYDWADLPGFRLYDTSFFHAFNDEPSKEDLTNMREWTPAKLAALAKRWNEEER